MCFARWRTGLLAAVLLVLVSSARAAAADRYDSRLRFRTWRTAHFEIHAHQGEEALAVRLAAIVEGVRRRFQPSLGVPPGRVHVILVDQADVSNGWATPFPYDVIEITAVPPLAEELIGNTTDWLELVFTHEYTHVLHLDRSRGFMRGVRAVFGRAPFVFSNALLPIWQIEGFATYEESRQTGEGRVPAGDFRAIVDAAARQRRFAPIDRANGGLDDWPAGNAAYAYGAYFHQYLADRYGPDRLDRLADATAGRLPLFGAGAFRDVYGTSLGTLWRQFQDARERGATATSATDAAARRLTHDGFVVAAPRVAEDGAVYFRSATGDGFPALMRLDHGRVRRVAWRVLGERTTVGRDWVVFDQVALVRSTAVVSDLYAVPRAGGRVVRLTHEARAQQPDLSPDGRRLACVVVEPGRRALALLDFDPRGPAASPRVLVDDPASDFSGPRWSPDGTQLVAERRRRGVYELVLVDVASGAVRPIVSRRDARVVTPAWTRDGSSVLFAADPGGAPFNIFALDVRSGRVRQITDSATGAQSPELAPDGALVYVGYSADGYDLYSLPPAAVADARPSSWPTEESARADHLPSRDDPAAQSVDRTAVTAAAYRPVRTLLPRYWQPILETDAGETLVGAGTAMADALGRHAYSATAAWSASRPRPDWSVAYAYDRWRPTLFVSYADDTDPIAGGEVRGRELFAGALLPFRHVRWSQALMAGFDAERDTAVCAAACRSAARDVRSARAGWLLDSRRAFPYSISFEEGGVISVTGEGSRGAGPAQTSAAAVVLDARVFHRVLSRHTVVAARVAAAASRGDAAARRLFSAAGSGPSVPSFDLSRDAIGLLRGVDREDAVGAHAAVINAELRFPILRVQRGAGTWPIFIRALHGAAFADNGAAWDAALHRRDVRRSVGGELSLDTVLAYSLRLTLTVGAAWTHDPVGGVNRAAAFARIGSAF